MKFYSRPLSYTIIKLGVQKTPPAPLIVRKIYQLCHQRMSLILEELLSPKVDSNLFHHIWTSRQVDSITLASDL